MEPEPRARGAALSSEGGSEAIEAFLGSTHAGGLDYIARGDLAAVLERFLAVCGGAPERLRPEELKRRMLADLPRRYAPAEPLGQRTIDVLRTYLRFLEDAGRLEPDAGLREALEEVAEPFRERVRSGAPGPGNSSPLD